MPLRISVIVPVRDAAPELAKCLDALRRQTHPPAEVIVVDDGSADDSAQVASERQLKVLRCDAAGPAAARNHGVRFSTGEILLFVDADIRLDATAVEQVHAHFMEDPELVALFGAYNDQPACAQFVSQFKNLQHCYVHRGGRREASTFWTGIGAIRRDAFLQAEGFNQSRFARPSIEDADLGMRLRQAGARILLDPTISGTHAKTWTLRNLLTTDIRDRAIPWVGLAMREGRIANDLNLSWGQMASVALTYLHCALILLGAILRRGEVAVPWGAAIFLLLSFYWLELAAAPHAGALLPIMGGILLSGWAFSRGFPGIWLPVAILLAGVLIRFLRSHPLRPRHWGAGLAIAAVAAWSLSYLPSRDEVWGAGVAAAIVLLLNWPFYLFLAKRRGWPFALSAIPFHGLYFLYCGVGLALGVLVWFWKRIVGLRNHEAPNGGGRPES